MQHRHVLIRVWPYEVVAGREAEFERVFDGHDAWARFLELHCQAYEELDRRCAGLTVSQSELAPCSVT